jgi:hypothetical protein
MALIIGFVAFTFRSAERKVKRLQEEEDKEHEKGLATLGGDNVQKSSLEKHADELRDLVLEAADHTWHKTLTSASEEWQVTIRCITFIILTIYLDMIIAGNIVISSCSLQQRSCSSYQ